MIALSIVLCTAVVFVSAENADLSSNPRNLTWDERVQAAANDSSLQARASAANSAISNKIYDYRNYKPAIFGPTLFKIAKEYGGDEIADCMRPLTRKFSLIQANVSSTEVCVIRIKKYELKRPGHQSPSKPWSWNHGNHLHLPPPTGGGADYIEIIEIYPENYEQSLDECARNFEFDSVPVYLENLMVEARKCIGRHFDKYPTTCFDGKGFDLDLSLECVKIKMEM